MGVNLLVEQAKERNQSPQGMRLRHENVNGRVFLTATLS